MSKDFGQGIFTMEFISKVAEMKSITEAQQLAIKEIDRASANNDNKTKAIKLVNSSRTIKFLVINMANFSLSHQGLKTL